MKVTLSTCPAALFSDLQYYINGSGEIVGAGTGDSIDRAADASLIDGRHTA